MSWTCFNCKKSIKGNNPICPNCFVVQKKQFTREQLFDYLETMHPTKPTEKSHITSYRKKLETRNYEWWLIFGLLSFGIIYYYYLLLNIKDLNDHWMHPHGKYETITKTDVFISMIILLLTNFLGVPLIQYMKYEKFRKHLITAPPESRKAYPLKGKAVFWFYLIFNIIFLGTISIFFFGLSALLAGLFFEFNSNEIAIVFFIGATFLFILLIVSAIILILIEYRWQEIYNYHIRWHTGDLKNVKRIYFLREKSGVSSDV